MAEPEAVASVIFGYTGNRGPNPGDSDWVGNADGFDLSRVDFWRIHSGRIGTAAYRPTAADLAGVASWLRQEGFIVEATTGVGLSFSGTRTQFLESLRFDPFDLPNPYVAPSRDGNQNPGFPWNGPLETVAVLEVNASALAASSGPSRRRVLQGMATVPAAAALPWVAACRTGPPGPWTAALCDSLCAGDAVPSTVDQVAAALGTTPSGGANVRVTVVDSGVVPGLVANAEAVGNLDPDTDEQGHGTAVIRHLLAVAPDVEVRSIKYVDNSGYRNFPVAAFQLAVSAENDDDLPHIVVCSWVMVDLSVALQREIAEATRRGVMVIFAGGNGTMADVAPADAYPVVQFGAGTVVGPNATPLNVIPDPEDDTSRPEALDTPSVSLLELARRAQKRQVHAVVHPDVMSVGGVTLRCEDALPSVSSVAASFDSALYPANPDGFGRHAPELCGLVAPDPGPNGELPALILTPTAADSTLERKPDAIAGVEEVRTAGTSMAAGHVAGLVARVLQSASELSPNGVRNLFMATAAGLDGWTDRAGFGLARPEAWSNAAGEPSAFTWLEGARPRPYLRQTVSDPGTRSPRRIPNALERMESPDVLVRAEAFTPEENLQVRLGLPSRHVSGPRPDLVPGNPYHVYVRVSNRGQGAWASDPTTLGFIRLIGLQPGALPDDVALTFLDEIEVPTALGPGEMAVYHATPAGLTTTVSGLLVAVSTEGNPSLPPELGDASLPRQALIALIETDPRLAVRWLEAP